MRILGPIVGLLLALSTFLKETRGWPKGVDEPPSGLLACWLGLDVRNFRIVITGDLPAAAVAPADLRSPANSVLAAQIPRCPGRK